LNEGKNSLDESIALITAANEVVNDPSSVGTALKTLTLRLRGSKTELEEAGLDIENMATTTSQLQAKLLALTGGKVDIMLDANTFKNTTQILREMADAWGDMNDIQRAHALELMGGKRQANVLSALIQNFETVEEAIEASSKSAGSALKENERYLDSIQGRIDQFNNALQSMWSNVLDDDLVKLIVQAGTELLKVIDNLGVVKTLVLGIGTYIIQKNFKGDLFGGLLNAQTVDESRKRLENLKKEIASLQGKKQNPSRDAKIKRKQERANTLDASIKEYDTLSEKLQKLRIDHDGAKKALDDYNKTLTQKAADGIQITDDEIAQQSNLIASYEQSQKAVVDTETALKQAEVQAKATGMAGRNAGASIKTLFTSAGKAVWKFAKEMAMSMAYTMAFTAIFEAIGNIGEGLAPIFKNMDKSAETLQEKLSELENELSSIESELDGLKSELKDTYERIEELMSQGSLTFVEQEELNKLKSVSAELKAQIGLQENLQKSKQQGVNSASIEATNAYLDTSFMSEQTRTEKQEKWGETGEAIGQVVGTVGGAVFGAKVLGAIASIGGPLGTAIGIAAGSIIGGLIGTFAGEGLAGAAYDSEQTVGEAMDSMLETRAKLKEEQDKALAENDAEAYNEATEALRTYDSQMSKHISQIQQNYNAMDWESASIEDRKTMMEYADWLDKYNISMGTDGAKSNAIARIFGDEATGNIAKARDEINKLKKNLTEAKKNGKGVDEALAALEGFKLNLSEDEVARLREMGIYLYEVEDYFKDVVEAESEFVDSGLEDVAKDINKITDGLDSLKTAFDEVIEGGVLTSKTILSLKESLGIGDSTKDTKELTSAWSEYLKVMMSGVATTEQMVGATERLTQAWIEDALANDNLTTETKMEYIAQLRSLGVENAEEYVDDLLQKNMVKELQGKMSIDDDTLREHYGKHTRGGKSFDDLTEVEKQDYARRYGLVVDTTSEDIIADIEKRYGVEKEAIEGVITALKEKVNLENKIADEQNKQKAYDNWYNIVGAKKGFGALSEEIKGYQQLINEYNSFSEKAKVIGNPDGWTHYTARGTDFYTQYTDGANAVSIDGEEFRQYQEEAKRYHEWLQQNSTKYQEYLAIKEQYDKALQEGITNGWVDAEGNIIDQKFAENISNWKSQMENIENEIDDELTVNVQLKLDLQNKSELVDDIQNVFDTLADAVKEYNENGYLTVDTAQALTDSDNIDPKYLTLLQDSNGQLSLTKDKLYEVAIARLTDLKIKRQDAIITEAENLASSGAIEKMRETTEMMYGEADALQTVNESRIDSIETLLLEKQENGELDTNFDVSGYITNIRNQVSAVGNIFDSAIDNIHNSVSSSGNTTTAEVEDAFQKLMDYWDNRIEANQAKYDQIQSDIDWLESQGKMADANYYKDQIALLTEGEESKEAFLEAKLQGAKDRLAELEAAGKKGSDEWWEAAKIHNDTMSELDDVRDTVLELQDAIGEIEWSKFEELNSRLDDLTGKLETIRDLIAPDGEEDWFDEEGNWSEKGVAVLGSYVQSLEFYKNGLNEASEALQTFQSKEYNSKNAKWFADNYGINSEQEYYDYLQKLTDEQYNYASSVSDTEQDIAGMWESQVDAVEEYFGTLIESYNDYIDSVKEALDAERDLYGFKKNVQKQSKDIAALERRIASLSGSTNASDIAERRKLESELYESRESLNDTYYDHSKQSQQEALEAESVAYEETMNRFVENLRTNLDLALQDMGTFIAGVTSAVTANAPLILDEYNKLDIALDGAIVTPWQEAKDAMKGYTDADGLGLMNSWTAKGGVFDVFATDSTEYLESVWDAEVDPGDAFATSVGDCVEGIVENIRQNVVTAKGYLEDLANVKDHSGLYNGGDNGDDDDHDNGGQAKTIHDAGTVTAEWYQVENAEGMKKNSLSINGVKYYKASDGYYYKFSERTARKDAQGNPGYAYKKGTKRYSYYAKGTTGTPRDEFSIVDEFGPELILHADPTTGRLQYLTKGSGVVPHDATVELMKLADLGVSGLMDTNKFGANVNMISNAINKPEIVIDVENFLKVDRVDKDSLPQLEAMMDKKIDTFAKQLNYSIKRFSR
jgi:hypothetical protein